MDGKLFLVRHLLILKEMTAGLELGKKVEKRDWGGITGKSRYCRMRISPNRGNHVVLYLQSPSQS